jgi:hypothetical protein
MNDMVNHKKERGRSHDSKRHGQYSIKKKSKKEINKRNYRKIKENEGFMIVKQSEPKQKKKKRK